MSKKSTKKLYSISEAADLLSVSIDSIRRWEKKGLIKTTRSSAGNRLFYLEEINRIKNKASHAHQEWRVLKASKSKIKSIELFSGAGGLALGFHNAGITNELVIDFDKDSINTIRLNRPKWNAIQESVTTLNLSEYREKIDVVSGGFPCQAFSYAGKSLGFADTRGTLFYEFARLVNQVKPKILVGENVKGLLNHDSGRTLRVMINELEILGYRVGFHVLRSQFFDVPQKRERLIIFGIREDLKSKIFFPQEKDYTITMKEALKHVPQSPGMSYSQEKKKIMNLIPEGGYWKDLPVPLQKKFMGGSYLLGGGKTGMARRLSWDEPSLTLTCNPAQKQTERCHPSETRPLSVREYARIQTFPDSWEFTGSVSSQYRQIGNAVPVNLAYHVGLAVREMLDDRPKQAERRPNFRENLINRQETLF